MPVLKCSKKLIKALGKTADKLFPAKSDDKDSSVLGGWSANLVLYARMRFVLFINDKTLLTIFIHLIPKEHLFENFQQALFKELIRLKIPADKATEEALKFQSFTLGENPDRSMRGYLKQMAFDYEVLFDMQRGKKEFLDIEEAQALANETPHVKREHDFPEDYVIELFSVSQKKGTTIH